MAALQPPKPSEPTPSENPSSPAPSAEADPPGWPKAPGEQVRAIQQALVELKLLRDKPDGVMGPMTRAAIKSFQRSVGARETGEPSKEVFAALQEAQARRDNAPAADLGQPDQPPPPPTSADFRQAPGDASR